MLLPVATVVARLVAVTARDLHIVLPGRRALYRKSITDVDADMARKPDSFSWGDVTEVVPVQGNLILIKDDSLL